MKNIKENVVKVMSVLLAIAIVLGIVYGIWIVKRKINYSMEYQSQVEAQITEHNKDILKEIEILKSSNKTLEEFKKQVTLQVKTLEHDIKIMKLDINTTKGNNYGN